MYVVGENVLIDKVFSHVWFNIAGSDGDKTALDTRNFLTPIMTKEEVSKAQTLAKKCLKSKYQNCEY